MDATPELSADRLNELYRARIAVSIAFFIIGVGLGIWAVHIPLVSARLNLNSAVLGFVLLVMAIGAVAGMPLTGALLSRFGSRLPTAGLTFAFAVLFPLPILAGNFPFLLVSAFLFGAATGGADVAMNTQASEIEKARGRPTMSSFHGFYSVGGLAGSIAGAAIIASGWGNGQGAVTAGVVCLGLAALAAGNLWVSATPPRSGPRFVLPSWAVIGIGMLCFLCFALEGAIGDWSALYLTIDKLASPAAAASGYALYSLAMSVCRLAGDPVVARLGPRLTLSLGGVLVAVGIAVAVTVPSAFLAPVGFPDRRHRRRQHRAGALQRRRADPRRAAKRGRGGSRHPRLFRLPRRPSPPRHRRQGLRPRRLAVDRGICRTGDRRGNPRHEAALGMDFLPAFRLAAFRHDAASPLVSPASSRPHPRPGAIA